MLVKVENSDYIRDTQSMGISNTNIKEKEEYMVKSRLLKNQKDEIGRLNGEITSMKNDINDLKILIRNFAEKLNGY